MDNLGTTASAISSLQVPLLCSTTSRALTASHAAFLKSLVSSIPACKAPLIPKIFNSVFTLPAQLHYISLSLPDHANLPAFSELTAGYRLSHRKIALVEDHLLYRRPQNPFPQPTVYSNTFKDIVSITAKTVTMTTVRNGAYELYRVELTSLTDSIPVIQSQQGHAKNVGRVHPR